MTDRDKNYMHQMWGTTNLTSDYGILESISQKKVLREVLNDDIDIKKHDFQSQKQIHSQIRNDDDYDDWEYGTEPIFG